MAAMDAKRWVLGSPYFSCIRRARDLRDDMLRFSFAWRPRLRFLNPPPPWPRPEQTGLLFGIGPGTRVAERSEPINIEMSLSFLDTVLYGTRIPGSRFEIAFYR